MTLKEAADFLGLSRYGFYLERQRNPVKKTYRQSDGVACVSWKYILMVKQSRQKRKREK